MFLTADELVELTGAKQRRTQIRVLKANGIPFTLKLSGWPSVARCAIEGRSKHEHPRPKKTWSPQSA